MSDGELRTIIVDDEPPARNGLLELLEAHRNVQVIGEADSVANAASLCKELRPDLLFLDIELDDGLGFSLLPKLQPVPSIIFATAHNEFAVRAFEVNAIDYLLKPIMPDRLAHALERIHYREQAEFAHKLRESDQVFLESSTTARMVYLSEVSAITAEENYTEVWLRDGGSVLIRRTMSDWANALPTPMFNRPQCRGFS